MFTVGYYKQEFEHEWDEFVLNKSMNGTFLQTRKFINYHPKEKFKDCSICVRKGNELVAVLLACEIVDGGLRTFFGHKGTTFGGITISGIVYSSMKMNEMVAEIIDFIKKAGFQKIYLKMVPTIYQDADTDLIDYFLFYNGFTAYSELNFYMQLEKYKDNILARFTSNKRRDYRYSTKYNLTFKKLQTKEEIADYYDVLLINLNKLNLPAVHNLNELLDLKFNRFPDHIEFYGVFYNDKIISGSMLFLFDERVVHTQYLSCNDAYSEMFPMVYLIYHLIEIAISKKKSIFSFGICTEHQGRYLNLGLANFKEGFGAEYCINRSYEKLL